MDQVEQIKEKIDIVSLISEFVPLKKMGRNFKANCPFHNENTPSFVVSPERQIWHCFGCFPPGEKIKTPFGYHSIEDIDDKHWVISGKGNIRKVIAVMNHLYKGDLVKVRLRKLGGEVKLTSDHNVFAIRGAPYPQKEYRNFSKRYNRYLKVRARDQKEYQELINKYFPLREIPAGKLQKGDLLLYPINRKRTDVVEVDLSAYINKHTNYGPNPKKIPLVVPIDEELLKLIGYWIAEGSSHRDYIRFSLGNHEENFAAELVYLFKKIFGLEAKIYRHPTSKKAGFEITACHATLANIFENFCGKEAVSKHIPFIFQELPTEKQKVLLNAIHKGDGATFVANRSGNSRRSISTISRVLAEQITDILLRMDLFPTLRVQRSIMDKVDVNHKEDYSILWSEQEHQKYNIIYYQPDGTEYWLLPITQLDKEHYEGPVYNFTVDQDHSYIANNFAVANCQKGGDVYTFLMEYERLDFAEALRLLAKRTGVVLSTTQSSSFSSDKERIYTINALAKEFYHFVLTRHHAGARALLYLKERGIEQKMIETFQLGFSPAGGDALSQYLLNKKHYKPDDIIQAGLGFQKGRFVSDFFHGRLMFPLIDHRDNVVGFSGRIMEGGNIPSKYINTRETLAYHKGEHFFGINITKDAVRRENQAIVVEGEFDVISCFQHGISQVIAVKGTALTEMQVNLLSRYANKITFCFDGDRAGQEAIKKSLQLVEKKRLTATVIEIPMGKDPDESLKNDPGLFKKAIREDTNVYDYLFSKIFASVDLTTVEGKKKAADELLPLVSQIHNEIIKEHYLRLLSNELQTSYESIHKELERHEKKDLIPFPKPLSKQKKPKDEVLEEYLVALLIQNPRPKQLLERAQKIFSSFLPNERSHQKIIHRLQHHFATTELFDSKKFGETLPKELVPNYNTCFLLSLPEFENEEKLLLEVEKTAYKLKNLYLQHHRKQLAKEIEQKEEEGLEDEASALRKKYSELTNLLDAI